MESGDAVDVGKSIEYLSTLNLGEEEEEALPGVVAHRAGPLARCDAPERRRTARGLRRRGARGRSSAAADCAAARRHGGLCERDPG